MKKTCNGCKAFSYDRCIYGCELGYNIKKTSEVKVAGVALMSFSPAEECPKPKTNLELAAALRKNN